MCGVIGRVCPLHRAASYSPCAGLSAFYRIIHFVILVFPVCGVIGMVFQIWPIANVFPVCGVIGSESDSKSVMASIPRVRGYRATIACIAVDKSYSPCAGLSESIRPDA